VCRRQAAEPFPLDRLWIAPTNQLAREINQRLQEWRTGGARDLGILRDVTHLITPVKSNPRLEEAHQIDLIERIETFDLPLYILHFYEGDPSTLSRNINTLSSVVNGRRFWVLDAKEGVAVIRFENGKELTLSLLLMEKVSNGMKVSRWQVPLKLIYAGTVHRSHGMTLNRAVIDLKSQFCEHGQLYVALSRVRHPEIDACYYPNHLKKHEAAVQQRCRYEYL
jgi:hypothetical protein